MEKKINQSIRFWDKKCKWFETSVLGDSRGPCVFGEERERVVGSATYQFHLETKTLSRIMCMDKEPFSKDRIDTKIV